MDFGIVGLPGAGKTTLFSALTGSAPAHATGDMKSHIGVAQIPDPRLDTIATIVPRPKVVHATLRLVDIPGVPPGSDAKKLNAFLEHVRQVDAVCHVVRCFDDGSGVDPAGDIDKMDTELVLADLVVVESAAERAAKAARAGDGDARTRLAVLEKAAPVLDDGRPCRVVEDWSETDRTVLRSYGLITAKPVLYVANIAEDDLARDSPAQHLVSEHARATGSSAVSVCAEIEAELQELEVGDRQELLESLGLEEPAIGPLARAAHLVLGLTSFYTVGDKEIRAWAVPIGSTAPQAAGAVHTDMERGFIRAECYHVDELVEYKSEKAIREAGKLRSEGKHYQLRDGDVVHFLFNV